MEDLFRQFWWLLFPMAWFVFGGFSSFLNYRRQKDTLDLIKTYADKGQQPPDALLKVLDRPIDSDTEYWSRRERHSSPERYWSLFGLFGVLSLGFAFGAWSGRYGDPTAFGIVALVMGAVAVWSLINALVFGRRRV